MKEYPIKPLDIVLTEKKDVAIVQEVTSDGSCSIEFLYSVENGCTKSAWYLPEELTVLTSLSLVLAQSMAHPFGNGEAIANKIFQVKE